jgi:hypothetical protein
VEKILSSSEFKQVYKPRNINVLFSHCGSNSMTMPHTSSDGEGLLRNVVYQMQWMGLMICCGIAVKRMGMLGVSVWKMKALTVKMKTVTLIRKGRWNLTSFYVINV